MKQVRLSILGFGVVGQGLAELLVKKRDVLREQYSLDVRLVSVANAHHGFIYRESGLDIPTLLELVSTKRAITEHPGIHHWTSALDGLRVTGGDVLAEVTPTNLRDAEPGMSNIRTALTLGMHVITANKGPIALAGKELLELARRQHLQLRMESTVMAGTPVLSTVLEGMAGTRIQAIRGILNGTTNYILSAMINGRGYKEILAEAQERGYAEADPTADVEGYDAVAKTLILAALVFGRTLKPDQVFRRGIAEITSEQVLRACKEGRRIKLVASLQTGLEGSDLEARVELVELPEHDMLARIDGVMNAITFETDSLPEVTVVGPGAGRMQTGQGLLADLIAIAAK